MIILDIITIRELDTFVLYEKLINFASDIGEMANKNNNELEKRNQAFLIYQDDNGIARVNVRFEGEDVWRETAIQLAIRTRPCAKEG